MSASQDSYAEVVKVDVFFELGCAFFYLLYRVKLFRAQSMPTPWPQG